MKRTSIILTLALAVLIALPYLIGPGLVNATNQMLIAVLFALAYNLICGQAGMLSFGHAAYFGIGAFAVVHAMNALNGNGLLPTPLLPIVGGLAGLLVGVVSGWFATKRTGTYFAMITLAIAELLHSLGPQLKGVFGGEAGISTTRMPAWGMGFASSTEVYYLTLFWVVLSALGLYLYTHTPMGRLTLGLRENSHRLRFLGYDVHGLNVLVFAISAMVSGIAGGLQVISSESANYVLLDMSVSSAPLIHAYIGGVSTFFGPAIGAALMTFFGYVLSDQTQSWLLYQGILFVFIMMFMPNGLVGVGERVAALQRQVGFVKLGTWLMLVCVAVALLVGGTVFVIEMIQRLFSQDYRSLVSAAAQQPWPALRLFGVSWMPGALSTWLVPAVLLLSGGFLGKHAHRRHAVMTERQVDISVAAPGGFVGSDA